MAGLLDFLQSASNSVAGNVSGPVDLLGMALRKLGIPVPEDALGSSQWMQRQGLTRPVQQSGASLAGETFGLLSPIAAAAKAPQIAKGLLSVADNAGEAGLNAARRGQMGATVWHGSPHKFDKFDASKIGTGEGAQAYGHGLYLSDASRVAHGYKEALSPTELRIDGKLFASESARGGKLAPGTTVEGALMATNGNLEASIKMAKQYAEQGSKLHAAVVPKLEALRGKSVSVGTGGNLYKVDLPDEKIARMLDWDKPLSQQAPEVQKALKSTGYKPDAPDVTGSQVLMDLAFQHGGEAKAAEILRKAGVPGAKYLDGVSRGAGEGSRNYVVFPGMEDLLTILERNGVPLR